MVLWLTYNSMLKSAHSVHSLADSGHQRLVAENRVYFKTVCAALRLTVIQLMSQMGRDKSDQILYQDNFLAILKLVAEHDTIAAKKVNGHRNARYTHHTIQNELIGIMTEHIKKDIARKILQAGCFAIMVDETKDCSKSEQLSFVTRYVHGGTIKEEFIGFEKAGDRNADCMTLKLREKLYSTAIDIQQCVGQCYDGTSVMSGSAAGVQAEMRALVPQAI